MKRLLASCFGLGRLPVAPGTWGSLPSVVVFVLMRHFGASVISVSIVMVALVLAGSIVCIKCASASIAAIGKADPGEIVADEFAGQALTFLPIGVVAVGQIWAVALLGFLLFRFFDIVKPWPIRKLEKLPGGWGVLLDDLLAGIYAAVALLLCRHYGAAEYLGKLGLSEPMMLLPATVLGTIQGLTEFLPVSSSGHLIMFEKMFGFKPEATGMLLFDLTIHVGTVAAVLLVLRKSIRAWFENLLKFREYGDNPIQIYKKSPSVHFLTLAIAANVVTMVIGLMFRDYFESVRSSLGILAVMWIVTGTLLLITDYRKRTRMGLRQFGVPAAIVIGLAQAVAIMPGISRSGATICAAILLGLHRRWAVEFSMLIGASAILGAAAIEFAENYGKVGLGQMPILAFPAGAIISCIVGILALKLLIKTSRNAKLKFFAFYCYALACLVAIYLLR